MLQRGESGAGVGAGFPFNLGFRVVDRHPCKSLSTEKHEIPGRAQESAHFV